MLSAKSSTVLGADLVEAFVDYRRYATTEFMEESVYFDLPFESPLDANLDVPLEKQGDPSRQK